MTNKSKTRYAVLGMLLETPRSGYEIKSLMKRSTVHFWRESDSTIYPMLKALAKEKKVRSKTVSVGKKKKEVFSITASGRKEFEAWIQELTGGEIPRNEFLLKLFFEINPKERMRLFEERLEKLKETHEEYKLIEERLESKEDSSYKEIRLELLQLGISQIIVEIKWLKERIRDYVHH